MSLELWRELMFSKIEDKVAIFMQRSIHIRNRLVKTLDNQDKECDYHKGIPTNTEIHQNSQASKDPQKFPKNPSSPKMPPTSSTTVSPAPKTHNSKSAPTAFSGKTLKLYTKLYSALSSQLMVSHSFLKIKSTNLKNSWADTISAKFKPASGEWSASWT